MPAPDGVDAKEWKSLCVKARSTVQGEGTSGIEFNEFKKKFRDDWSKPLSEFMLQYRFNGIEEMLQAMPEYVRMVRKGMTWHLYAFVGEDEDKETYAMNAQHIDAGHNNSRKKKNRRGRAQYFSHPVGNAYRFSTQGMRRTIVAPPQVAPRMYGAAQEYHGYQRPQPLRLNAMSFYNEPSMTFPHPNVHGNFGMGPPPGLEQPGPSWVPQFHAPVDAGAIVAGQVVFAPPPPRSRFSQRQALQPVRSGQSPGASDIVPQDPSHSPADSSTGSFSSTSPPPAQLCSNPPSQPYAPFATQPLLQRPSSPASVLSTTSSHEALSAYEANGRPKIYRFVEIVEAHGGKMAMTDLRNEYLQKYNESLAIARSLREVLGVHDGWKTTVSILGHVDPPIFKSEIRSDVFIILVPHAREMLDMHTWPNGYTPSQTTAMASASGTMADFAEQADGESDRYPETESSADYYCILPGLMGVPENVALIVTIGSVVFELCKRNEKADNTGIRLDMYDRKLPKVFPELLAEHCTPVELVQLLKVFFEDAFDVECERKGEMVITSQEDYLGPLDKIDETVENVSMILQESSVATLVDPEDIEYGTGKLDQVHVTFVDPEDATNGCVFALRLAEYDDKFEDMCQMLKEYEAVLRVDPELPPDYIETDGYYLHQSPQGLSRCQVVDLYDDGRVRVDFVDEGRRATVDQDELIDLPRTFWDFPEFAVLCTMNTNDKFKLSTLRAQLNELTQTSERLSVYAEFLKEDEELFGDLVILQTRLLVSPTDEPHKEPLTLPDAFN
ncbi:hypothetical protein AAVH_07811 [Aphelenchoides avenae]|nr:hypothetical protein AAVH_07811 [Aphelenchus avenae]